jgi:ATP-binding cassette subfamily B protein
VKNQHSDIPLTSFVLSAIRPFRKWIIVQIAIPIIFAIDLSLRPILVKVILDNTFNIEPSQSIDTLWKPASLYIFMSMLIVIISRLHDWILLILNPNLKKHICLMIIQTMLKHSHGFYQNHLAGSLANKVNDIIEGTINVVKLLIDQLFGHIFALILATCTIWQVLGPKFAFALIIWVALFLTVSWKLSRIARTLSDKAAEAKSSVIGYIVDIFSNMLNVRLFNREILEVTNLSNIFQHSVYAMQKRDWFFLKMCTFQGGSFVIFQAICLWWLILGFKSRVITPGDFGLIFMLNIALVNCLWTFSHNLSTFAEAFGNVTQGLRVLYSPPEVKDNSSAKSLIVKKGTIVFENVWFFYKNSPPLFKQKSVVIKPGEKVGLVGYSGSGKSTFVNLILRLFDVTKGRILIDGQDIRDVTQASLLQAISMIPQDPFLFHRSIMDNIKYGKIDASKEEIIKAAKRAHAHEFINALPLGYQSLVGERGVKLSGGQRQRIIIARAILKNAPILILDEATSQLDSITENQIQENFWDLMQDKTTIVIAHRLSTLLQMDRILVFNEGTIIQDGRHDQLVGINGLYKTLWDAQVGGFLATSNS